MSFENTTSPCTHLVMLKLIPLVQDLEAWKHHFREMAKGNRHKQYVVKGLGLQTEKNPINIKWCHQPKLLLKEQKHWLRTNPKRRERSHHYNKL